jgi:hypothetical protein
MAICGKMNPLTGAKIAKFIFGVIFIPIGIGICLHPMASDHFNPGTMFGPPRVEHISAGENRIFGIFITLVGLGLLYSTMRGSRK